MKFLDGKDIILVTIAGLLLVVEYLGINYIHQQIALELNKATTYSTFIDLAREGNQTEYDELLKALQADKTYTKDDLSYLEDLELKIIDGGEVVDDSANIIRNRVINEVKPLDRLSMIMYALYYVISIVLLVRVNYKLRLVLQKKTKKYIYEYKEIEGEEN
jgi:hypothetical protein